jgi:hypothetical protein
MSKYHILSLIIAASYAPTVALGQNTNLGGLGDSYQQFDGSDHSDAINHDPHLIARQTALAAASEPVDDTKASSLEFSGSLKIGVNTGSGGYGRATIAARQRNIGGSNVSVGVSLSKGFD